LRNLLAAAVIAFAAPYAAAAAEDAAVGAPVPPGVRFGMTAADLEAALGVRLKRLPGRWGYGGAYAEHALADADVGGVPFAAYFQMSEETGRLQQVLFEHRGPRASAAGFAAVAAALAEAHGPPVETCAAGGGGPAERRAVWRLASATVHAAFTDFRDPRLALSDPNRDADPLDRSLDRRRNNPRFLPRRIVVRAHPPDRRDLEGAFPCPAGPGG
jgi:hypothetical protein